MKNRSLKPRFELIFSLCILVILGLPPLVFGQSQNDLQINITNGDTTVNGKSIKDLTLVQRKEALKDINHISSINNGDTNDIHKLVIVKRQRMGDSTGQNYNGPLAVNPNERHIKKRFRDSTVVMMDRPMNDGPRHKMKRRDFHERFNDGPMGYNHKNTQNFIYNNIDNDGIATQVSYHVSDHTEMLDHNNTVGYASTNRSDACA